MRCAIIRAHLPSRSQQSEMMRTPRNRRLVWRHERFRLLSVLAGGTLKLQLSHLIARVRASQQLESHLHYEKAELVLLAGLSFMDSVERCFAAATAIGLFVTVVGMILLQTI